MLTREEGLALARQFKNQNRLNKTDFAQNAGVGIHVLRYWLARADSKPRSKKKVHFVELQASDAKESASHLRVELPTGATLHFEGIPDPDLLLRLVSDNRAV